MRGRAATFSILFTQTAALTRLDPEGRGGNACPGFPLPVHGERGIRIDQFTTSAEHRYPAVAGSGQGFVRSAPLGCTSGV